MGNSTGHIESMVCRAQRWERQCNVGTWVLGVLALHCEARLFYFTTNLLLITRNFLDSMHTHTYIHTQSHKKHTYPLSIYNFTYNYLSTNLFLCLQIQKLVTIGMSVCMHECICDYVHLCVCVASRSVRPIEIYTQTIFTYVCMYL